MGNSKQLFLGTVAGGGKFQLPVDMVLQTFAILAIRGAGKTTTATVMAEELCEANQPWISFDPVGVWYGLRSKPNGKPGGYPVLVIGGDHADFPLERTQGAELARALMAEPVCAVIDLSKESKRFWHTFITDFCMELMNLRPEIPRHIFIEEAPEFVPQKTRQDLTARCKEAIERLIRLGRNNGYGCTLISQRPATVDKDVLSQCENLLVMRTPGPHDRKALKEWIEAQATDIGLSKFLGSLAGLPSGTAYFWSPQWQSTFKKVKIRQRYTFHPGATRTMGRAVTQAELCDVGKFVTQLENTMVKIQKNPPERATAPRRTPSRTISDSHRSSQTIKDSLGPSQTVIDKDELEALKKRGTDAEGRARNAERRVDAVRKIMGPQYKAMQTLFGELGDGADEAGDVDMAVWQPWLNKAGRQGARRMLEILLKRPELTKQQLGTLAGIAVKKSTFRNYMSWLKTNGLVSVEGNVVKLLQP